MRKQQLYSLFEKMDDGKWKRLSPLSFFKQGAVSIFQGRMISMSLTGRHPGLRVVKGDDHSVVLKD